MPNLWADETPNGAGLLGAMSFFALDGISGCEKDAQQNLVLRGRPCSKEERVAILDYCQTAVDSLDQLRCRCHGDLTGTGTSVFLYPVRTRQKARRLHTLDVFCATKKADEIRRRCCLLIVVASQMSRPQHST